VVYCYLSPLVKYDKLFCKIDTKLGTDHQSVQSGAGKMSCNETAL